jgi:hypothetical protein
MSASYGEAALACGDRQHDLALPFQRLQGEAIAGEAYGVVSVALREFGVHGLGGGAGCFFRHSYPDF